MRYEIRAMSFSEILDAGFQLLRNHFQLLMSLSLVLYGPIAVLDLLIGAMSPTGGDVLPTAILALTALPIGLTILIVAPIAGAAITLALGNLYLDEEVTFESAMRAALKLMLPLMGTSILAYFAIFVGFILLVVPGVYLMFAFFLIWQVMVLEGVFGAAALRRSHELMKGNKLRAFGIMIIGGALVGIIGGGLQLVLSFVPYLGTIGSALAQAVANVYTTAISVVLYFDIRCRKEAFDLQHLAQLVQRRGSVAPVAAPLPQ